MKILARAFIGLLALLPGTAYAQSYPSPTFNAATFNAVTANTFSVPSTSAISAAKSSGAYSYGGALSFTDTNIFTSYVTGVNSFAQVVYQNTSAGAAASTDLVVANNLGTATTYYGNFGINSSGFSGTGALNAPNAVYLTGTSGDLVLGTTTANAIHIVANGATSDALTITSSNVPQVPTATAGTNTTQIASTAFVLANSAFYIKAQVFTSSGTFTIPVNVTAVKATVVGGGGGSGGSNTAGTSPGGGGGGTAIAYLTNLTPGNTISVTVGSGGSPGSVSGSGGAGGSSSVSSGTQTITTATAGGGAGGPVNGGGLGGAGGTASGGTLNVTGGAGLPDNGYGGAGGGTTLGGAAITGANGYAYGGGAGGNTTTSGGGNTGAAGVVIVEW